MKRTGDNNRAILAIVGLCLAVVWLAVAAVRQVRAEDVDVYRTSVKNSVMIVADTSGSMSWPVFDGEYDYAGFMKWMIDEAVATDDDDCRAQAGWWDTDNLTGTDHDYDRLDPDRIYLVSSEVGHKLITYTDSSGSEQQVSAIGDVLSKTSDYNDSYSDPTYSTYNVRDDWLKNTIIEVKNSDGEYWTLADASTIETTTVDGEEYVVFPTTTVDIDGSVTVTNNYSGQRLPNAQDILLTNEVTDPRTGEVTDTGFVGFLNSTGYYFSGLFERSGSTLEFTDSKSNWETDRVYVFASGRWLNFLKLVEDFQANSGCAAYTYRFQSDLAWRNICDKRGIQEASWQVGSTTIRLKARDERKSGFKGRIKPPGEVAAIKVRFERKKGWWWFWSKPAVVDTAGSCSGTDNDFVDLRDANGNSLLAIKGYAEKDWWGNWKTNSDLAYSEDGGETWTAGNPFDADGYTKALLTDTIKVYWHNGSCSGIEGSYYLFSIRGYQYTSEVPSSASELGEPGDYTCCNGEDGYGSKIKSRIDVAKTAMKRVVQETKNLLNWGITRFDQSGTWDGGVVLAELGTDPDTVISLINGLSAYGSTPMGEAFQDAYNSNYTYFEDSAHAAEAECGSKIIILVTDGFPQYDTKWSRINDSKAPNYPYPTFGTDAGEYGDDDTWEGNDGYPNHSDDAAHWMYHEATHQHTVHAIGFGLDNPLLGDIADSSAGEYLTAYDEAQLINAFYTLGLAELESVNFVAPVVSVDQANRTQSGDDLYTAFFRPQQDDYWVGNLKKYKLRWMTRTDCNRTDPEWVVVDSTDSPATDCYGAFYSSAKSFWSQVADGGEVDKGGAGALLKDAMPGTHPTIVPSTGPYYDFRNIYTYDTGSSALERFVPANITNSDLGVSTDLERYKIINFVYGYTYDAEAGGDPKAKRDWILGDIIHSEPTIIDYLDANNELVHRFIIIGANDGLLHVFVDDIDPESTSDTTINSVTYTGGSEIWAFLPPDLLGELQNLKYPAQHSYFVDGFCSFYRARTRSANGYYHKSLVFGERRGGKSYWALDVTEPDPSQWAVKWNLQGGAFSSELGYSWSKPTFARIRTGSGVNDLTDVVIFGGGYDNEEDNYPEPWSDDDEDGRFDSGSEAYTDANSNGGYDYYNPGLSSGDTNKNEEGKGIFVVDLSDGSKVFSATYGSSDSATGTAQTYTAMKWCFPADPTVIQLSESKLRFYIADVYGQIWKVYYNYSASGEKWEVSRVFKANPGSDQTGATDTTPPPVLDTTDLGRKMFYSPDVSYLGNDWTNYPVLYFGTGDRSHPRYVPDYDDRFYVVADTGTLADETNLLNLTCDELDDGADVNQDGQVDDTDSTLKNEIWNILLGITDYPTTGEKCRGWYRKIGDQGSCTDDSYDHEGEKVLSKPTLFYKVAYFTTFKPVFGDPCNPTGDAGIYALEYSKGKAALDFDLSNNPGEETLSDTYRIVEDSTIPSGIRVITRSGHAAGVFSAGGSLVGAGEEEGSGFSTTIPGPPGGVSRMLWETY